ncbi:GUN4 domain-containing protein [Crocosphaera sp.]|uniref:GUN4 domain-containing protein n=1 Tax=Crocosphaera sp. TaxID=2729996 RepID=UPI002606BD75|nr:GUN4 domain-containing protein [Crocosphaera sp.]MDJ0583175.1 GUN4 domain-containing protein [Crocosphaera sp.]
MKRIFISHSHSDEKIADSLFDFLIYTLKIDRGDILCTSDPESGLSFGSNSISDQLKQNLKSSDALIVLITPDSLNSAWIPFEVGSFWPTDKPIIIFLGCGLTSDKLPGPLRGWLGIRMGDEQVIDHINTAINQLSQSLNIEQTPYDRRRQNKINDFIKCFRDWKSKRPNPDAQYQQQIQELQDKLQENEKLYQDKLTEITEIKSNYQTQKQELEQKEYSLQQLQQVRNNDLEKLEQNHKAQKEQLEESFTCRINKLQEQLETEKSHQQSTNKIEIRIIKFFLASSSELKEDREQFEIFINRKNKQYIKQGIFLELVIWEDFLDAMSQTRLQDEYNKVITECDLFVSLFLTKVGQYTEEEFDTAFGTFKENNKPLIYTYFKDAPINLSRITTEINTLLKFKEKLSKLGHFYTSYNSIEELKYRFEQQLNKAFDHLIKNLAEKLTVNSSRQQEYQQQLTEKESIINQLQEKIQQLESNISKPILSTTSTEIELKSEKGVDYTKLRDLLAAGEWKEADHETAKVMLQAANRMSEGWLYGKDIDNFPCDDLRTIDKLWVKYSNGKFGFSVQKKIYMDDLGGTRDYDEKIWDEFCDRVGWRKRGDYVSYSNLTFELLDTTPVGHLPVYWNEFCDRVGRGRWGKEEDGISYSNLTFELLIFSRISHCKL